MAYHLCPNVRFVIDKAFNKLVFLFNPYYGSWVVITSRAHQYLNNLIQQEEDPLSLGLQMGFSHEEITQFLTYLMERNILRTAQQPRKNNTDGLRSCYIHVTQKCNLSCRTCYSWQENRNTLGALSTEQLEKIIEQLAFLRLQNLVISGGEPLTRNDLPQILHLAKEKYHIPKIILITNGTLVTNRKAMSIAPYVDEITVSLDGPTEEINAQIRGKGNFERALRGIRIFKASSAKSIRLVPTLTHVNVRHLREFQILARELEIELSFSMFVGIGAGSLPESQRLALTQEDLKYLGRVLTEMGGIQIDLDGTGSTQKDAQGLLHLALASKTGCGAGNKLIAIGHNGNVYPCHMLMRPELCMGNLLQASLSSILTQTNLCQFFRYLQVDQIEVCNDCTLRYFCGGGCRASAYGVNGNLLSHDPACQLYQTYTHEVLRPLLDV